MTTITIRERPGAAPGAPNAELSFDHGAVYPITVADPFSKEEEENLEWYFETHLQFPFTDQVRAAETAAGITRYGQALFDQVFADRQAFAAYSRALQAGVDRLCFEIAGSPEFHALHWEALQDPALPRAFSLDAPMVRKNLAPQPLEAVVRPAPAIRLLVVVARPYGRQDVGYRTISRPLVEGLRQAGVPADIDFVRPGSYQALVQHLAETRDRHEAGYYHVVHFDLHGALLTYDQARQAAVAPGRYAYGERYARPDLAPYAGLRAYLAFEAGPEAGEAGADLVEAGELAALLLAHQVPVAILNACQSGKQVGAAETSLGARLMQAGAQLVVAMAYTVTVSAAERLMRTLYAQLLAGHELPAALRRGREELYNAKGRRVYFDQELDLEDWLLPVAYQNREVRLAPRDFTSDEAAAYYDRQARGYRPPEPAYGFVGRDLDILHVERRLLAPGPDGGPPGNWLLLRGLGGAGKTTLLRHLGWWWQATGLVDRVFYYGYDERAWTREQIMHDVAQQLLGEADYHRLFVPLGPEAQQALLAARLRAQRHLLILDNLESITGSHLAIRNTLPEAERALLGRFLAELRGGRTLLLLGSRGGEEWLAAPLGALPTYDLPGLDAEAASTLAERILLRHGAERYRAAPDLRRLLALLAGHPLALEVILPNLARQAPGEVLAALQAGDEAIDLRSDKKTESILRCVDYSFGSLSEAAQALLACLAPFTTVLFTNVLDFYSQELRGQPALAGLAFDRWPEVLAEAAGWGLLGPHPEAEGYLRLQPVLPYFLRARLAAPGRAEARRAVEAAFRGLYDQWGGQIAALLQSKEPRQRQAGRALARLEYENLAAAVDLALAAQASILNPYKALSFYLDAAQDHRRGLALGEKVLARLESYPPAALAGPLGAEFVGVIDDIAKRQLLLKQHAAAGRTYRQALDILSQQSALAVEIREKIRAGIYHQLGRVAQEQRHWAQAEQHYRQALALFVEFGDRYGQASTYHQLGMVAQAQRQWAQAEQHYRQALALKVEVGDRYEQAGTYHQLGYVAQEQRQWAQAEAHYRQALALFVEFGDRYEQAKTYHQLGRVAQEQRHWAQAEAHYRQALALSVEFGDRYAQASTYHQLGIVAQQQRHWAQAEAHYRQALAIFVEFGDRYNQASTYHQLGVVAQEQQQWAQAQQHLLQALQIFREAADEYSAGIALRSLSRLWRAGGDAGLPAAVAAVLGVSAAEAETRLRAAGAEGV